MAGKAATKVEPLTLTFNFEKETKNTRRFQEVSDADRPAVGTLYITKDALAAAGLSDATAITVTVEADA